MDRTKWYIFVGQAKSSHHPGSLHKNQLDCTAFGLLQKISSGTNGSWWFLHILILVIYSQMNTAEFWSLNTISRSKKLNSAYKLHNWASDNSLSLYLENVFYEVLSWNSLQERVMTFNLCGPFSRKVKDVFYVVEQNVKILWACDNLISGI